MIERFTKESFYTLCNKLASTDKVFKAIITDYSYPPFWTRPNSFETLVLTILEQQVSLASAYAAYKKLKERIGKITPENILVLNDEDLRSCYLSRQKTVYVRELANAILSRQINLKKFYYQEDDVVRTELKNRKGIGDWTVDIYLIHALKRTDIFPLGDLALVNGIRMAYNIPDATKEDLFALSNKWKPYRSIATMIFWHYYIKKKNIRLLH
ncbi:MAG: DNA-3-methyladenine glycosylase 2 family protein [Chitinophagaceae bacterium]